MARYFMNPANRYIEKATGPLTWLWALLFGPFYFVYKGAWQHALLYFALFCGAAAFGVNAAPFLWLILAIGYAIAAYPLAAKTYRRSGWIETTPEHETEMALTREPPSMAATPAAWSNDRRRV